MANEAQLKMSRQSQQVKLKARQSVYVSVAWILLKLERLLIFREYLLQKYELPPYSMERLTGINKVSMRTHAWFLQMNNRTL